MKHRKLLVGGTPIHHFWWSPPLGPKAPPQGPKWIPVGPMPALGGCEGMQIVSFLSGEPPRQILYTVDQSPPEDPAPPEGGRVSGPTIGTIVLHEE